MPDYQFRSDGCSFLLSWTWWTLFGHGPPWEGCCDAHDKAYWLGGTREDRRRADRKLRICATLRGHPYWGAMMEWGVWVGGVPWLPTRYRWGYGWRFRWGESYGKLVRRIKQESRT